MSGTVIGFYSFTKYISSGAFGTVWECRHLRTNEVFACKVMEVGTILADSVYPHFRNELAVHSRICHPGITQFRDVILENDNVYVFLEMCEGGDLASIVTEAGGLPECDARRYFGQIMGAIAHIHDSCVAHRDIKLENILVTEGDNAKLSDFGLSKATEMDAQMKTTCGTLVYAAPEIVNGVPYDGMKTDIWSAGIALYVMVANRLPWDIDQSAAQDRILTETARQITSGEVEMDEDFSDDLQNLLSNMLDMDPQMRPSARDVLEHLWFEGDEDDEKEETVLDEGLVEKVEAVLRALEALKARK